MSEQSALVGPTRRRPRFPSSKFAVPKVPGRLVRRSTPARRPGPRTSGPASPWWWARPGRARPPFWPTGWPPTRSDQRRGSAVIPPTPSRPVCGRHDRSAETGLHLPELGEDARQLLSLDGEVSADVMAALATTLTG